MIMFQRKDVWCLLCVIPGFLAPLGVRGAPRECPPGGKYFDKHLGQWGRYVCCSELCKSPGSSQDQCSKKCPNYEEDKARDTKTTVAPPSDSSIGHAIDSPPDNDNTNPSSPTLYILTAVAVLLLFIVLIALFLRVRRRGLRGLLPTISPQRATPGVRYDGENVVLPGHTPPQDEEARRKLLAGSQPPDRFPEAESCGGNPVGGAGGGPARGGELCQTAKEDAPPIQVQEQDQGADGLAIR